MTDIEARILQNQIEIMWTLSYLLGRAAPELAGRGGELDRMRGDLAAAAKDTRALRDRTVVKEARIPEKPGPTSKIGEFYP